MIEFLIDSELICDAQTVLEARDNQMHMTPLHIAALNPDPMAVKLGSFFLFSTKQKNPYL